MSAVHRDVVGLTGGREPWILDLGLGRARRRCASRRSARPVQPDLPGRGRGRRRWVLRRPPLGQLLASAHDVAREHRILRALEPTAVPTPEVLGLHRRPGGQRRAAAADGARRRRRARRPAIARLDADRARAPRPRRSPTRSRASTRSTCARPGSTTWPPTRRTPPRQLKRWRRQWEASRTRELPAVERLAERLEAAMPEQREVTLVHGDFHLLNVIAAPGGGRDARDPRLGAVHARRPAGRPRRPARLLAAGGRRRRAALPRAALPGFPRPRAAGQLYAAQTGRDVAALPLLARARRCGRSRSSARACAAARSRTSATPPAPASRPRARVDDLIAAPDVLFEAGL